MQLYSSFFQRRGCEQRFFHSCALSPTLPQSHFWILDRFQRSLATLFPFTNPTFPLLCKWVGISSSGSSFVSLPTLRFSLPLSTRSSIFHIINFFFVKTVFELGLLLLGLKVLILSDLESDYVNPFDASSRINYFVLPEFIGQGALCALCLFTGHWFMFLLTVPVTCYHARL